MEILFWIVCVSMLVPFGTGVLIGYLLVYWSMNGQTGCPEEPMRVDRAMETEGTEGVSTTSQSFEFSHAEMASSSSFSHKVANKIGDGGSITYLTGFGSVGKFLPCMECGQDAPPRFYENRIPQPVKRK